MNPTLVTALLVAGLAPGPLLSPDDQPLGPCTRAYCWSPLAGGPGIESRTTSPLAESTHAYDVRHYRLDFDLPMTDAGYACREEITIVSEVQNLDTVVLDFAALTCDSAFRGGVELQFSANDSQLAIVLDSSLPLGDSAVIGIFFHRDSTTPNGGYFFGRPPQVRYAHAMTCGCPRDNHYWFACWDWPYDKAERGICINLTVPDTFQTCSNGLLDSVTAGPGTRTWWWRHSFPISTYLMTFSVSRFASWETLLTTPAGDTVPFINWMWPEDSAATRNGYRRVPQMMSFYADPDRFGPYPFDKFGHVPGYYGFAWAGMEHQTLVMLHPSYIGGGHESTIAHELSHMWWGDMVTHVGYADVWLNEGFATYAECICMGHLNGRGYFDSFIRGKAGSYFSRDRQIRFPIYDPPWQQIYDYGHIYCKGAWVQHMLRWVLGDTAWDSPGIFFEALRAYADSFPYGTVSTPDYRLINEQLSGVDLDWFFDEWIYQAGYPKYELDWRWEPFGDSFQVVTALAQRNGTGAPDFFRTPLPIRINCLYIDTLVAIKPSANPQVDTFVVESCPDSLTIDPDNWILDSAYLTGLADHSPFPAARLLSVAPNPAGRHVRFQLGGPPGTAVGLAVYDRGGRSVETLAGRLRTDGTLRLDWQPGPEVPAGVYFCRAAGTNDAAKLVLLE